MIHLEAGVRGDHQLGITAGYRGEEEGECCCGSHCVALVLLGLLFYLLAITGCSR